LQHAVELAELDRFLEMPVETRLSGSLQVFLLGIPERAMRWAPAVVGSWRKIRATW